MRVLLPILFLFSCGGAEPTPSKNKSIPTSIETGAALTTVPASTPATTPTSSPATKPADKLPRTVIATFIDGEGPIIACGVFAFVGVYVYEIESVVKGDPLSGKIVVDVLCPDFAAGKVKFKKGERHSLELEGAKKAYAGSVAPKPPQGGLPRYSAKSVNQALP